MADAIRHRSPNYPAIDLPAAIQRAQVAFDKEGRSTVSDVAVLEDWGYKGKNGRSLGQLAALKHFGLLDSPNRGQVRLSDLALKIILNDATSPDRRSALREAALNPTIHQEIQNQFPGGLPSDSALRVHLVIDRGFSDSAATDLIREIRSSFEYAGVNGSEGAPLSEVVDSGESVQPQDQGRIFKDDFLHLRQPKEPGVLTIPVPLAGSDPVTIEGKFPISEASWTQFMAVLAAMKPGLVRDDSPWELDPEDDDQLGTPELNP